MYDSYNSGYNMNKGGDFYERSVDNPNAKINKEQLNQILFLLINTNLEQRVIAREFELSETTITDINNGNKHYQDNIDYPIRKPHVNPLQYCMDCGIIITFKSKRCKCCNTKCMVGENHHNSIYSNDFIIKIKQEIIGTVKSLNKIAMDFNEDPKFISSINVGYNYRDVGEFERYPLRETRLNKQEIQKIVKELKSTNKTYLDISKDFKISEDSVGRINRGETWEHITHEEVEGKFPIRTFDNTGSKSTTAILNEDEVKQIVWYLSNSNKTITQIADIFNIGKRSISAINNGETWRKFVSPLTRQFPIRDYIIIDTDFCKDCGREVTKGRDRCPSCSKMGQRHPKAKLTEEDVKNIVSSLQNTSKSYREIGEIYNCSLNTVSQINQGNNWKSTTNDIVNGIFPIR